MQNESRPTTLNLFDSIDVRLKNIRIEKNTEEWRKLRLWCVVVANSSEDIDGAIDNYLNEYQIKKEKYEKKELIVPL